MVTGSVAAAVYGDPRLTRDVDVVLEIRKGDPERLLHAYPETEFYLPPPEVLREEAGRARHGHVNLVHHESGLKADLYLLGQDPLHRWAFERRVEVTLAGEPVWLAPPEYVILRKLEFYREGGSDRHVRDIRAMLAVSGDRIDRSEITARAEELGLTAQWRQVAGEG